MKVCDFIKYSKHEIVIQSNTPTGGDYGGESESWATLLTVWSAVEPLSGKEVFQHQQLQSQVTHRFTIRFQSTLTDTQTVGKYRISYDSRLFDIKYIRNINEMDKFIELYAVEGEGT